MKRALILGIGGQDGSYLADILLERGYEVHGVYRRSSSGNLLRIAHVRDRVTLHQGDMADPTSIQNVVDAYEFHEVYNEADQDSVGWSHAMPSYTYDITFAAVGRLLEMLRLSQPNARVFQPCSAMMFGDAAHLNDPNFPRMQNEDTSLRPMSPYACAKAGALHLCRFYREYHKMHVSVGILYNHDSVRRTEEYLLHKIAKAAVRISRGRQETLALGNLDALVDIGCAREYMAAAHAMLQQDKPGDYVIATGETYSVEELTRRAFEIAGVTNPMWRVTKDESHWFPVNGVLCGDSAKARRSLGFSPTYNALSMVERIILHYQGQP